MDDLYEDIKAFIANNSDVAEFAEFGDGVSPEWIKKAEVTIGIELPPSYKWWLGNYGGGEVGGEEVFSVYEQDFDTVVGGDIVYMHRLNQSNGLFQPHQLAICESDIDGTFYFDTAARLENGECPIKSSVTDQVYANDFLEFLEKRIKTFKS